MNKSGEEGGGGGGGGGGCKIFGALFSKSALAAQDRTLP